MHQDGQPLREVGGSASWNHSECLYPYGEKVWTHWYFQWWLVVC